MSRAARYGGIQPSEFLGLDWEDAAELARRVTDMAITEMEMETKLHVELTKALLKAQGAKIL